MKRHRKTETSDSPDWFDEGLIDQNPTRLSGFIFFVLCVMLIFSVVAYGAVDAWALALLTLGGGLIILLWCADSFFNKQLLFNSNALQLPLLGLILIGLIQLFPLHNLKIPNDLLAIEPVQTLSLNPTATRLAIVRLAVYFIFFTATLTFVNNQNRFRKFVFIIITFASVMAFLGIIQRLAGIEAIYGLRPTPQQIFFGSLVNQHHFAAFMEMTIGLTLNLLYGGSTKRDKRWLLIIALVLMGSALILTGSRGGVLSLLAVLAFTTVLNLVNKESSKDIVPKANQVSRFQNKLLLVGSSLGLLLLLIVMVLFLGGDSSLMRGTGLQSQTDISTGRLHFWQVTLQIIAANPIIGAGLEAFGTAFTKYDTWNGTWRVEQAHNDYLQILADAGILGFACVAAFIYFLYKQGFQIVNRTNDHFRRGVATGALAGCFGILVHSFFDFPLRTTSNSLFFLSLAALATNSINYPKLYKN